MKAIRILAFIVLMGPWQASGQNYSLYSNDSLIIASEYLGETIRLNFHLPETHPFSAPDVSYPITIVFDSQHLRTYPQIIGAFDLLTSETQVPESIIVGVPFTFKNRLYFTSSQKREGDTLSGIERMELFLFSELIPKLQKEFRGNNFITVIGHSRTGFLVNYLAFRRPAEINVAASLSGFFNDEPLSLDSFLAFLTTPGNFPEKFRYYYTSGTTNEEITYLKQSRKLDSLLSGRALPGNVGVVFNESPGANHITNYWVSVPPILIDAFSGYNSILDTWFHEILPSESSSASVGRFEKDLEQAGNEIGVVLNPNLTHIYSLASHFAYSKKDYARAIEFLELGVKFYPSYPDLYVELIAFHKALDNPGQVSHFKDLLREIATGNASLSADERGELLEYLDQN